MYKHTVQYYETDKMGITHHSNYIRWMEEARVDYLENIGYGYEKLEEEGIFSPVIGIECDYKHSTTFRDEISIDVSVEEFKGVRLVIKYKMTKANGDLACEARSKHCFLDQSGRPVRLSKVNKEFYDLLVKLNEEK